MILKFTGGIRPAAHSNCGRMPIEYASSADAVCLFVREKSLCALASAAGENVLSGSLLAENDGTPVYSPISGVFRGILEIAGSSYLVVMSDGQHGEEKLFPPETRALTEIDCDGIISLARQFSVSDSRSGLPLWKMMDDIRGKCRRVLVDCTDCCPESAIAYRICIEKSESVIGGAKILLHALGAEKGVIAVEEYRRNAIDSLASAASDPALFAFAPLEDKFPISDRSLMEAVYVKELRHGDSASDEGCLIVGAETAAALYDCICSGRPQTYRFISVCGEGFGRSSNLCVPDGMTSKDIFALCGGLGNGYAAAENDLLGGIRAHGTVMPHTRAFVGFRPEKKKRLPCIGCSECAAVCTARLDPRGILSKSRETRVFVADNCLMCGCCEYICPCGIPLRSLISRERKEENDPSEAIL